MNPFSDGHVVLRIGKLIDDTRARHDIDMLMDGKTESLSNGQMRKKIKGIIPVRV